MYYYRARYYDPQLGRFVSQDPIGFAAGDANLYRYVGNSPIEFLDPTGLVGLPTDTDSPSQAIWQSIRKKAWDTARDLTDDLLQLYNKGSKEARTLESLKSALKQMKNLDKWRKQVEKWSKSDIQKQIKTLQKTLDKHLKVRKGIDTPETQRMRYQLDYLEKLCKKAS